MRTKPGPEKGEDWKERLRGLGLSRKRGRAAGSVEAAAAASAPYRQPSVALGRRGEEIAERFLEERGVSILARNVRYSNGELDLIGMAADVLLFVEVKRRRSGARGSAAESVTPLKRSRVLRAARRWLAENPAGWKREVRFDVIAIQDQPFELEWIRGAFDASK
jgi:putative endonuclease